MRGSAQPRRASGHLARAPPRGSGGLRRVSDRGRGSAGSPRSRAGVVCDAPGPRRGRSTPRHPRGREPARSEEHTSELQSQSNLVCRLLLEKKKKKKKKANKYLRSVE